MLSGCTYGIERVRLLILYTVRYFFKLLHAVNLNAALLNIFLYIFRKAVHILKYLVFTV